MQLLHGLCCFDFISDIPLPPATLKIVVFPALVSNKNSFFLVKRVLGRGPERREPNEAVLCLLIIIVLISSYYILLLNFLMINYGEPSQPKLETELKCCC